MARASRQACCPRHPFSWDAVRLCSIPGGSWGPGLQLPKWGRRGLGRFRSVQVGRAPRAEASEATGSPERAQGTACRPGGRAPPRVCARSVRAVRCWDRGGRGSDPETLPSFATFQRSRRKCFPLTDGSQALACSGGHLGSCQVPRSGVPTCQVHWDRDAAMSVLNGLFQRESLGRTDGPCGGPAGPMLVSSGVRDQGQGAVLPRAGPASRGGLSV